MKKLAVEKLLFRALLTFCEHNWRNLGKASRDGDKVLCRHNLFTVGRDRRRDLYEKFEFFSPRLRGHVFYTLYFLMLSAYIYLSLLLRTVRSIRGSRVPNFYFPQENVKKTNDPRFYANKFAIST